MNLKQAEAIMALHEELIRSIDQSKLTPPTAHYQESNKFSIDGISLYEGGIEVSWSRYVGCGDYDRETTHHNLSELFED
jgi:hypothetical protein